ncbi:MAG: FUSC family protein [Sulfurimonas sp.]|jgi:uncharacterized membrane protein YccC
MLQMKQMFRISQHVLHEWLHNNVAVYAYMIKAVTAALLALGISMELSLADPRTAIFTVFIVMNPQSGLVFSKSYYRILGTIAGVGFSLLLVGLFAQEPFLFIFFSALWIGLTTAGGFKYRNFQSYGFILAGYTVAIVAFPAMEAPLNTFDIATARFSEIIVGILCATFISDVLFPRRLSDSMLGAESQRIKSVLQTVSNSNSIFDNQHDSKTHLSHFLSGMVGLNAIRINSSFESVHDKKRRVLYKQLNHEFMNLSTTYHSLKSILFAIESKKYSHMQPSLHRIYAPIASAFDVDIDETVEYKKITAIIKKLSDAKVEVASLTGIEQKYLKVACTDDIPDDFAPLANLVFRLLEELHVYFVTYKALLKNDASENSSKDLNQVIHFSTRSDSVLVALAALRGVFVLIIAALFWKLTAWPYAIQTISMAVVSGMLFSTLANPLEALVNFFKGSLAALLVATVLNFYLIPHATDFFTLALILTPPLAAIGWWTTQPKWTVFALGFIFMFMYQTALDPYYKMETIFFFENAMASLLGIILAGVAYMLINFWSNALTQKRVEKVLNRMMSKVCNSSLIMPRAAIESKSRDLIQHFSTQGRLDESSNKLIFDWLLSILEIARAVISIRQNLKLINLFYSSVKVDLLLQELGTLFEKPTEVGLSHFMQKLRSLIYIMNNETPLMSMQENRAIKHIVKELGIIRMVLHNKQSLNVAEEER